ncbi:hypothetical protein [Campylobacter phage CP81]|uniref:Uncharacterized protein n=1 Tax=Campylobacter phage CP81 TaxID=2927008 RepID=G0LWK3_9CAUD|nr:hypothetical protein FDJ37_gp028 [Campylobacter phage CP81]CBZ42195.1 hypothetical protein [Campylobacter phage CP81]
MIFYLMKMLVFLLYYHIYIEMEYFFHFQHILKPLFLLQQVFYQKHII